MMINDAKMIRMMMMMMMMIMIMIMMMIMNFIRWFAQCTKRVLT